MTDHALRLTPRQRLGVFLILLYLLLLGTAPFTLAWALGLLR